MGHLFNVDILKLCEGASVNKTLVIFTARLQDVSGCLINIETMVCKGSFKMESYKLVKCILMVIKRHKGD